MRYVRVHRASESARRATGRLGVVICCIFVSASAHAELAQINAQQFYLDSGLKSSDVGELVSTRGSSHYRMRLYRFTINEAQAERLSHSAQPREARDSPWLAGVARLVNTTQHYLPEHKIPYEWTALLPPYATEQMQCFTTQAPDFGFRYLRLTPSRGGKRLALLALGQQQAGQTPQACLQSVGNHQFGSAYWAQSLFGAQALPYPFARRLVAEKLLLDYQPKHLDFEALIFLDSIFWFRFSASKAQYEAFARRFDLRKPEFSMDDSRHAPEWFNSVDTLRTRCWLDIGGNAGHVTAYWQDGLTHARVSGNLQRWQKPCPVN